MKQLSTKQTILTFLILFFGIEVFSVPMIRLKMKGLVNSLDETVVYYQSGATDGFDAAYDAYKFFGANPAPYIYQRINSTNINTNGIAPVATSFSVQIKTTTHITGNFTITAEDFEELPVGTCAFLKDMATGMTYNILMNPYTFLLKDTTSAPRFILTITHFNVGLTSTLTQPSCQSLNSGEFKIAGLTNAPWNYTWIDSSGTIVKSSLNLNVGDSLDNLSSGVYTVEILSAYDGCYSGSASFTIQPQLLPTVSFTAADTIFAGSPNNYQPTNQSLDCVTYNWMFGNGASSTAFQPQYTYTVPGTFNVKLVGTSSTGCVDSLQKVLKVMDITTFMKEELNQSVNFLDLGNNIFRMELNQNVNDELTIQIISTEGKIILERSHSTASEREINFDLNNLARGMYVLCLTNKTGMINKKVVVK